MLEKSRTFNTNSSKTGGRRPALEGKRHRSWDPCSWVRLKHAGRLALASSSLARSVFSVDGKKDGAGLVVILGEGVVPGKIRGGAEEAEIKYCNVLEGLKRKKLGWGPVKRTHLGQVLEKKMALR